MQAGQSDWKHVTKYTIADGQTGGIWYDAGGTFIGDNKTTLEAADDAATRKLGSLWRMPTKEEIRELLDHCTWNWTTQDGVNGCEVKGPNGNSIFLPAAGYRWFRARRCRQRGLLLVEFALRGLQPPRPRPLLRFGRTRLGQLLPLSTGSRCGPSAHEFALPPRA
ncbi:hypothetical protein [Tannerella forsythia]